MMLLRIIFVVFGFFFAGLAVVGLAKNITASRICWKSVDGTVLRFELIPYRRSDSPPSYEVKAVYSYSIEGKLRQASMVQLDGPTVMSAPQIGRQFGSIQPERVTVFYDPQNPSVSVLIRPTLMLRWVIVAFSALLSFTCFVFTARMAK